MPAEPTHPVRRINIITRYPSVILLRQEPESQFNFVYSSSPVEADYHVVVDVLDSLHIPNHRQNCFFVVAEPPEVRRYDKRALAHYGVVIAASFQYLKGLPNLRVDSGLLPWRVGLGIESSDAKVFLTREALRNLQPEKTDTLSVVTSQKAFTRQQIQRLRLIDYLSSRIPEMRVYGRGTRTVDDKAEALIPSKYHLALENCQQPHFWTEKLSDAILTDNVTFYSGRNLWNQDFDGLGAIIEIQIDNPRAAYISIRRAMDEGIYEAALNDLLSNKTRVLEKKHLHAAIERAVVAQASGTLKTGMCSTKIPAHRSTAGRLTSWLPRTRAKPA